MKIVIAPDSYKESLSASEVAQAIEKGFREIFPDAQYVSIPVADGGEGTVEAMIAATQGSERHAWVTGPLGEKVNASWGTYLLSYLGFGLNGIWVAVLVSHIVASLAATMTGTVLIRKKGNIKA